MKAHSEKFMNVSDMQVPDEDDRHDEQSRSNTIKANSKTVKERSPANSKIVKERMWNNPVTSKIVLRPLEPDTDAQLHEESVLTVRKAAKLASRVLQEKCPR